MGKAKMKHAINTRLYTIKQLQEMISQMEKGDKDPKSKSKRVGRREKKKR